MPLTPVAVFTYNRPEHTRRVLASLAQCERLAECQRHVYCDGARTSAHQPAVVASRQTVRAMAPALRATVIERPENLGLARSIVTAVRQTDRHHVSPGK